MSDFIEHLRFRLLELGCPSKRLKRAVREVADHREDLVEAALAEGITPREAQTRADASLGNPKRLAEELMISACRSSWCGRHRFIVFAVIPLLAYPLLWAAVLCLNLALGFALGFGWDVKRLGAMAHSPATFPHLAKAFHTVDYVSIALVALLFCVLAGRFAAGRRWMWLACSICAVYSLFIYVYIAPHFLSVGLTWRPQWIQAVIPLLILSIVHLIRWRRVRHALKSFQDNQSMQPRLIP